LSLGKPGGLGHGPIHRIHDFLPPLLLHVLPFLLQLWMFASPVIYPLSLIPAEWRWLFYLNPLVGVIDGFRSSILGLPFAWTPILWSCGVSVTSAWLGLSYFRRIERRVADLI